jgi:translation initiation factor eIF-2B subunit epsilon
MFVREAIVLAGGEDTRLHPLTSSDNPKCLLPVANVPALLYSLVALQKANVAVVFVVCWLAFPMLHENVY